MNNNDEILNEENSNFNLNNKDIMEQNNSGHGKEMIFDAKDLSNINPMNEMSVEVPFVENEKKNKKPAFLEGFEDDEDEKEKEKENDVENFIKEEKNENEIVQKNDKGEIDLKDKEVQNEEKNENKENEEKKEENENKNIIRVDQREEEDELELEQLEEFQI